MKIDDLVKTFAVEVANQARALDPNVGNRHAKGYVAAFNELRTIGDEGREALTTLFTHRDADVRTMAAAFLLRYCEPRAREVLEKEAQGEGLVAFSASQALMRWDEGTWELDPAEKAL